MNEKCPIHDNEHPAFLCPGQRMKSTRCTDCPYMVRLRKDGTIMRHRIWMGANRWQYCDGSGKDPIERTEELTRRDTRP